MRKASGKRDDKPSWERNGLVDESKDSDAARGLGFGEEPEPRSAGGIARTSGPEVFSSRERSIDIERGRVKAREGCRLL